MMLAVALAPTGTENGTIVNDFLPERLRVLR